MRGRLTHNWTPWNSPLMPRDPPGALDVQQARTGGHPLGVTVGDQPTATVGVGVLEGPVHDVGDGLESAVGMPGRAFRLTGGVLDLTHLIHVDERVGQFQGTPANARRTGNPRLRNHEVRW